LHHLTSKSSDAQQLQCLMAQSEQSDAMRAVSNTSQSTEYEYDGIPRCDTNTTTSSDDVNGGRNDAGNFPLSKSAMAASANLSKRQNYFRGYVDLRYKDELQDEDDEATGTKLPITSVSTNANV